MELASRIFIVAFLAMMVVPGTLATCGEVQDPVPPCVQIDGPDLEAGSGTNVGVWLGSFFRDHISAVDGSRCPSLPTCSSYSVEAFRKHGFLMGWVMVADRLVHEIDEWAVSPVRMDNGRPKILDPVENNDFWWFDPDGTRQR